MNRPIVVIKVGGSLLDWPELPGRLTTYLNGHGGDRVVLLVGGGRFVDVLRDLDARHSLGEVRSHALALRALDLTAHVLAGIVPGLEVVEDLDGLPPVWSTHRVPVLAPRRFLDDDRSPDPLPHAWTTTSDAIAARLAVRLGAARLVLLKSAPPPPGAGLREVAHIGLVDPEFPRAAEGVPIVTLRDLRGRPLGDIDS